MVWNIFYFPSYLGRWSNLTNIFVMGWNHRQTAYIHPKWGVPSSNPRHLPEKIFIRPPPKGIPRTSNLREIFGCLEQVSRKIKTGWWFQRFFIFTPIWGRFPIWLIFFKGVETTNQKTSNWIYCPTCLLQPLAVLPFTSGQCYLHCPCHGRCDLFGQDRARWENPEKAPTWKMKWSNPIGSMYGIFT